MRINKLIFENLNSYEGKVEIDFTDPAFAKGNNQFVICGPMGAGKSTILDAITLALFGSTARLGRMTISSKDTSQELMNKKSVFCSATVIYSCAKGSFESSFLQRRARGKLSGNLQPPECRIVNIDTGEDQIDSKTTDALGKKNEQLIGLSYDQFVRCILIPQGEFETFLKSNDREKAAILAKLSHTEYYKQVAVKLNEKASEISKQYHELEKDRDRFVVLPEEDRSKNEEEKQQLFEDVKKQTQTIQSLQEQLSWLHRVKEAEKAIIFAQNGLERINSETPDYLQRIEKLAKANKAKECESPYQSLKTAQKTLSDEKVKEKSAEEALTQNQKNLEGAEEAYKAAEQAYSDKKKEKEQLRILWDQVIDLDSKLSSALAIQREKRDAYEKATQAYESSKTNFDEYQTKVKQLEGEIAKQSEYLKSHTMDADLSRVLAVFREKKTALSDAWMSLGYVYMEIQRLTKLGKDIADEKERLQEALRTLEDRQREFVSDRYKQVVAILRRDLVPGKPCPVCQRVVGEANVSNSGFVNEIDGTHRHTDAGTEAVTSEELSASWDGADSEEIAARTVVAENVSTEGVSDRRMADEADLASVLSKMEDEIHEIEDQLTALEGKRIKQEGDLEGLGRESEKAENQKVKTVADLNELLVAWDIHVAVDCDENELTQIETQLSQRNSIYQKTNDAYTNTDRIYRDLSGKLEAIDLDQAKKTGEDTKQAFELASQSAAKIRGEREALFGSRSVKDAENQFEAELSVKEAQSRESAQILSGIKETIQAAVSAKEQCVIRIGEAEEKIKTSQIAFAQALQRNGFDDETAFLSCKMEADKLQTLEAAVKNYEKRKTEAETSLKNARDNLTKLQETPLTQETAEALEQGIGEIQGKIRENSRRIGALEEILKNDDLNKIERAKAEKRLEDMGKEGQIFARISDMLGKNDGSDFEVFVQSIAMKSLLAKANQYLSGIIPKYELVQKSGSIDFEIYETAGDGIVTVRQVANFSGGERFIISLCLALAMSEFAGQNGDVECIFLDEGFGTLSGQPLLDAIDALKRLANTGKMLGIITHIETVIQAFMPIEAVKKGDSSMLQGPGVAFMPSSTK